MSLVSWSTKRVNYLLSTGQCRVTATMSLVSWSTKTSVKPSRASRTCSSDSALRALWKDDILTKNIFKTKTTIYIIIQAFERALHALCKDDILTKTATVWKIHFFCRNKKKYLQIKHILFVSENTACKHEKTTKKTQNFRAGAGGAEIIWDLESEPKPKLNF